MATRRLERVLVSLTPAVVGYRDELPYVEPERVVRGALAHFEGTEILSALRMVMFLLNVVCVLTHGRLLRNLDRGKQERFLHKCMTSRVLLMRGLVTILKIPLAMYYYDQEEVLKSLGYDRELLCEDADKHQVTR